MVSFFPQTPDPNQPNCPVCPDGTYTGDAKGSICKSCPAGRFSTVVSLIKSDFSGGEDTEALQKICSDHHYGHVCTQDEYDYAFYPQPPLHPSGFLLKDGNPQGDNIEAVYCCGNDGTAGRVGGGVSIVYPELLKQCQECNAGQYAYIPSRITVKPALDEYVYTTRHEAGAACAQMGYGLCSKADVIERYPGGICNAGFTSDGAGYVTGKCASDTSAGVWDDWTKYKGQKMTAWCCDSGIMYLNEGPLDHGYYSDEAAATDACKIKGETNGARYDLCERQAVLDRFPEGYCHFGYTNDNQVGFPSEEKEGCGVNTPKGEWVGGAGGGPSGAWCCRTPSASTCRSCTAGRYQTENGKTNCKACPTGKYQNDIKKTKCEQCEVGLYADVEGLSLCKPCPIGMYNPSKAVSYTHSDAADDRIRV